jgi:hypothetical protein
VELVRADADLRTQSKLPAIVEPSTGVHYHGRAVDLRGEPARRLHVAGNDRIRMMRSVLIDVRNCVVERIHHLHRNDRGEVFGVVVVFRRRFGVLDQRLRLFVTSDFNALRL